MVPPSGVLPSSLSPPPSPCLSPHHLFHPVPTPTFITGPPPPSSSLLPPSPSSRVVAVISNTFPALCDEQYTFPASISLDFENISVMGDWSLICFYILQTRGLTISTEATCPRSPSLQWKERINFNPRETTPSILWLNHLSPCQPVLASQERETEPRTHSRFNAWLGNCP